MTCDSILPDIRPNCFGNDPVLALGAQSSGARPRALPGRPEVDPEPASLAGYRFDSGLSTHSFDAFFDERKSYARAGVFLFAVQPLEDFEDSPLLRRIDADSVVFDPEPDPSGIAALRTDAHFRSHPFGNEFEGVGYEIREDLNEGLLMGHDGDLGSGHDLEPGCLGVDCALEQCQSLVDRDTDCELLGRQVGSRQAAEFEHVSNHAV